VIGVLKVMTEVNDITRSVTCMCDRFWWLGCVLSVIGESGDMKVTFLHPHGPSVSYIYPAMPYILWLPQSTIISKVSPNAAIGRTHTLTSEETELTAERSKTCNLHFSKKKMFFGIIPCHFEHSQDCTGSVLAFILVLLEEDI
jgi:hypothetical protein